MKLFNFIKICKKILFYNFTKKNILKNTYYIIALLLHFSKNETKFSDKIKSVFTGSKFKKLT